MEHLRGVYVGDAWSVSVGVFAFRVFQPAESGDIVDLRVYGLDDGEKGDGRRRSGGGAGGGEGSGGGAVTESRNIDENNCLFSIYRPKAGQADGRVRRWPWIEEEAKFVRVVFLEDGETAHNAFFDRGFLKREDL